MDDRLRTIVPINTHIVVGEIAVDTVALPLPSPNSTRQVNFGLLKESRCGGLAVGQRRTRLHKLERAQAWPCPCGAAVDKERRARGSTSALELPTR